jgi:aspartate-semialdehyde dehydrogenase
MDNRTSQNYRVAVVGATGVVGQKVLQVLNERELPIGELVPFASARSEGRSVVFRGQKLSCRVLSEDSIDGFDLVFSSAGGSVSREWAPKFAERGAIVIDKSSSWRMEEDVPLVVPEVNPDDVNKALEGRGIISSPNCSTMQMVVALNPIHKEAVIQEIVVSTYQSVSGTGGAAIEELEEQSSALLRGDHVPTPSVYAHRIAFNVLPQVEVFADDSGYTTEERKMMDETRKIMGLSEDELAITATCARVPVINCHSESIRIRTQQPISIERCRQLFGEADGIILVDEPRAGRYPLPVDAADKDEVFVGRLRHDLGDRGKHYLNMWVVGDNLRKGAATNAVQIAQLLHERGLASAEQRAALGQAIAV